MMSIKNVNAALNAPLAYLDGNPKKRRRMNKWEFRSRPEYRLLTSSLHVNESPTSAAERKEHRVFFFRSMSVTILSSLICILFGLVLGFLLMLMDPSNIGLGLKSFFQYGFNNLERVVYTAGPLMLCALSIGFCYKCGLFNIGAPGQYMIGGMVALIGAITLKLPWYVTIFMAIGAGALIGAVPGVLKAYFNVNEVITSIMVNWIVLFLNNFMLFNVPGLLDSHNPNRSVNLNTVDASNVTIPSFSSDRYLNITIIFGVILAIVLFVILFKTTFGYRLRAVGFNRDAADYAGISSKRNIILSFVIAGALSGLAGACYYLLGNSVYVYNRTSVAQTGFDAIPIALLANNNPLGIIFTTFIISFIQVSGIGLQGIGTYNDTFTEIMVAFILYGSAFAVLMNNIFLRGSGSRFLRKKKEKDDSSKEEKKHA